METKELKITIPEGFEIDKEKSTFEKIVFKKKNIKPRSWEEYVSTSDIYPFILGYDVTHGYVRSRAKQSEYVHNYCAVPSEELAEAFLAMMQLMSLRQAWIGDWELDWNNGKSLKWCIRYWKNEVCIFYYTVLSCPLSFPTKEMAEDFMNTFKDLLEIAKPLI